MSSIVLEENNRSGLVQRMNDDTWVVACLCAAWCDVCTAYRPAFDALAAAHPETLFVWIDVEDQADLMSDFDVENFPTVLIQRGDQVAFYGTTLPDAGIALRLLNAYAQLDQETLSRQGQSNSDYQQWQQERNLRRVLAT